VSIQYADKDTYSLNSTGIVAPFPATDEKVSCKSSRSVLALRRSHIQTVSGDLSDSSAGIATCYGLRGTGIKSRWDRIFRTRPDRL